MSTVITRVVRMTFAPAKLAEFEELFGRVAPRIRAVPGCRSVELLRDVRYRNIMTTLSAWDDEDALNRYRASKLFETTWAQTKVLFAAPPRAESYRSAGGSETMP